MSGKTLKETAKAVLLHESDDPTPDRGARDMNPNKATLRPGSRYSEGRFATPGSNPPNADDYEDLGPALTSQGDIPPSANANKSSKKDSSKSSQSSVPGESMQEEIEISEELSAFIEECIEQGLTEEEIEEAISENFEILDEDENQETVSEEEDKLELPRVNMKEHVDALLAGENLSEDFRAKAETIFESAVNAKLEEELTVIEQAYAATLEEEVSKVYDTLSEEVEAYLQYVVENWVKENEVAIESGLRTEITEGFITGLRNLFAEHYIDVPEDKVDIVDTLGEEVKELTAKLNEQIEKNVQLSQMVSESKQFEIFAQACDGLTATEVARFQALAEGIEYTGPEEFTTKLETLRESYFPSNTPSGTGLDPVESNPKGMITEGLSRPMTAYVSALGRTQK